MISDHLLSQSLQFIKLASLLYHLMKSFLDLDNSSLLTTLDAICNTKLIGNNVHLEHVILIDRSLLMLSMNSRIAFIHLTLLVPWNLDASSDKGLNRNISLLLSFHFHIISITEPDSSWVCSATILISQLGNSSMLLIHVPLPGLITFLS